ncbi:probable RNA-directed DNA polymerase from transposon X-element [Trichonephila clavipes]|uniref:Probable RNA-directed DNA polymerase from transposon X-element n=1 Tax=Trichonephila clavipes TaxID=2585209 RepID=A0A8X6SC42_TRICX|nr:probable RNA-directed DNA polymerase from transposon X-element [Trichonephila clavipes]
MATGSFVTQNYSRSQTNGHGLYTPITALYCLIRYCSHPLRGAHRDEKLHKEICNEKDKTVLLLRSDHGHDESDALYQLAWNEFQDVQGTLQQAVSDFDSLPQCTNPGCSHLLSPRNNPNSTPPPSPTRRNCQLKRKDEEDFEFPPLRKTARKTTLEDSDDIILDNQFSLLPNVIIKQQATGQVAPSTVNLKKPTVNANDKQKQGANALLPPVMMKITTTYREQVDTIKKCLKCGEEHLTKDCPIKQRLETKFCINCQVYGHMANWHGCPCFPKPPKGAAKTNKNTYTNLYNSFLRPNLSYAQVTNNSPRNNSQNKQQMAPRRAETSRQTEAVNIVPTIQIQKVTAPPIINSNPIPTANPNLLNSSNNNDIKALLSTTVQCLIQLLNAMNSTPNLASNFNTVNSAQADANQIGVRLLDFTNLANLYIAYPDTPTRFGLNSANTLDIAIIRNFYYPYTINSLHELSSDHNPVMLNFTLKLNKDITNPRAVHTNWPLFSKYLNTNLSLLNYHPNSYNSTSDIDLKISEFTDTVRAAHIHASRPIETLRKSFTPHHIHKLIKQKNQFRNLYHRTLDPHYKTLYNRAQKNVKKELKNYTNENWTARLQALSTQDNSLWAVQKFFKKKRSDIPSLHCTTGTAITDKQKADILAESILTNFTENERQNNDFDDDDEIVNNTVNAFLSPPPPPTAETAYPSEIISYIKSSKPKKAPGKDGISNRMTKNFTLKAILILTILINKILKHNYFPKIWKEAIIFPILKPGKSKNNPASYRPISLLSTLSKITESIILTRLKNIININKTINPNQYGFTNKLSTLHPLLNLTEAISEGFQRKKSTGAVFLDIQKAFDRVWLTGLTFKLITYNIPHPFCLLHSYNSDRSYQVRVKDTLSNTKNIRCGVAQGSLLGPLLFNLYINDIPDYTLTKLNMFADDTAVHTTYRRISSVTYALNKHLKLLEKYYDQWKISINVEKSAAVIFTKRRKLPPPPTMYNTTIPWSQSTKYLGIIFDKNLTWRTHIQHTRNKFRKIMFKLYPLIGRNSELSRDNKVLLFTAVMRPILAYGCPVWGYAAKTNINMACSQKQGSLRAQAQLKHELKLLN